MLRGNCLVPAHYSLSVPSVIAQTLPRCDCPVYDRAPRNVPWTRPLTSALRPRATAAPRARAGFEPAPTNGSRGRSARKRRAPPCSKWRERASGRPRLGAAAAAVLPVRPGQRRPPPGHRERPQPPWRCSGDLRIPFVMVRAPKPPQQYMAAATASLSDAQGAVSHPQWHTGTHSPPQRDVGHLQTPSVIYWAPSDPLK